MSKAPEWIEPADPGMPNPEVIFEDNGAVKTIMYRNMRGKVSRKHGPAITRWDVNGVKNTEIWLQDDKIHRADGPAVIGWHADGSIRLKKWYHKHQLHREDGPAMIEWHENGALKVSEWSRNGQSHREDGPAVESWHKGGDKFYEIWYQEGQKCRIDGPSYTRWENGVKSREAYSGNKDGTKEHHFDAQENKISEILQVTIANGHEELL